MKLKELTELHNRINILISHAENIAENTESNITHTETENYYRKLLPRNNSEEHKFYNKFTLHKQYTRENKLSLNRKISKDKLISENLNMENNEKIAITELYSRDFKQKHRYYVMSLPLYIYTFIITYFLYIYLLISILIIHTFCNNDSDFSMMRRNKWKIRNRLNLK